MVDRNIGKKDVDSNDSKRLPSDLTANGADLIRIKQGAFWSDVTVNDK